MKNEKNVVMKNHQVILNLIQDLQRRLLLFINDKRGRSHIKYGMTALFNNGGFTLIELLVVVLIIGILAAVAVPQYQFAIAKTRITKIWPVIKTIRQAQEAYYLNTGSYSPVISKLDVKIPCYVEEDPALPLNPRVTTFYCDSYIWVYMAPTMTTLSYCPGNKNWSNCWNIKDLEIEFYYQHSPSNAGKTKCNPKNSSKLGTKLCKSLTLN